MIAYPGDHTSFEAPPLGRGPPAARARAGRGRARAGPGARAARRARRWRIQLASGRELRLRVAGVVSSLDHDGRVAYVPGRRAAAPPTLGGPSEQLAIGWSRARTPARSSAALGARRAAPATGAVRRAASPLVAVLRSILRAVAIVDGLVCLYALVQALRADRPGAPRARSRCCAPSAPAPPRSRRLLAGAVVALVVPAAVVGVVLERLVLGPALSRLAASYATLPLGATAPEIALVLAGLALAGAGRGRVGGAPDHARERDRRAGGAVSSDHPARGSSSAPARCSRAGCGASGPRRDVAPARRWRRPGSTRRGTGTLAPGPGEPLIARTELGAGARRSAACSRRSPTSPTPTCWTPRRRPGCRSSTGSGRRSSRPSARRRR